MTAYQLTYDLADKVLDGVFDPPPNAPLETALRTYTLDGQPLSAFSAAFRYETDIKERGLTDRATALTEFGNKVRVSPSGLKSWMGSDDFSQWAKVRKMPSFDFHTDERQPAPTPNVPPKLTKEHSRRGGVRTKFRRGLQEAVRRIADDLWTTGKDLTFGNFRTWLEEHTRRGRDDTMKAEAYSFEPGERLSKF